MNRMEKLVKELNNAGHEVKLELLGRSNEARQGIVFTGKGLVPVIYEDMLDWQSDNLIEQVLRLYEKGKSTAEDIPEGWQTKEFALKHVYLGIGRKDWNAEYFKDVPYESIGESDLIIYPRVFMNSNSSFKATNQYIQGIGVNAQEIFEAAKQNEKYFVKNMKEMLAGMMGISADMLPDDPMNILSNESGYFGAAGIYDVAMLNEAMEKLECNLMFVIPSSVHEVICIPENAVSYEQLQNMICEVNTEIVAVDDRLSDHPYVFDGKVLRNIRVDEEFDIEEFIKEAS